MGWMSRRRFLGIVAGGAAAAGGLAAISRWGRAGADRNLSTSDDASAKARGKPSLGAEGLQSARIEGWAMGAAVSIVALHERRATAEAAVADALAELQRVERVCSIYRPDSDLARLNRDGDLRDPHADLVAALSIAADVSQRTAGAFDVTVQPLWSAFADAQRQGRLPDAGAIESARRLVGWQDVDVSVDRVRLARPGMAVTLNGVAQGLAADRVLAALARHGIEHALVNTGEVGSIGHKEGDQPWKVGIQHPRHPDAFMRLAELDGRCLATSGDYATRFGEGYNDNHIFDPATGHSPTELSAVTVLAPRAADADALSTAVFVLGVEKGLALVRNWPRADALLVDKAGRSRTTEGFPVA